MEFQPVIQPSGHFARTPYAFFPDGSEKKITSFRYRGAYCTTPVTEIKAEHPNALGVRWYKTYWPAEKTFIEEILWKDAPLVWLPS